MAQRLEGMTRHASVHAAGVVIAPRPLTEFVPLYKIAEGRNRHPVGDEGDRARRPPEDGLPRAQHADADRRLPRRRSSAPRASISTSTRSRSTTRRPTSCSATARPTACSSSRARACASCCARPSRERLDDLIALNALYRPGPLKAGMVDDYISRKQGKTEVKYELPQLEPILTDTYGVIAYQEQVMRIASVLAGFTMGQADVLRKAMGKKDPKVMAKQREAFMAGAQAKGINEKKAKKIFDLMEFFAGYGFNKSHSTTYALLAYQTAYLKANYPRHFMAALLTIEAANTDKLAMYLGRVPRSRRADPAARHQHEPAAVHRRDRTASASGSARSRTSARARSCRCSACARSWRPHRLALHALRAGRPAAGQQAVLESLVKAGAFDSLAPAGRDCRRGGRGSSPRSTARSSTAAATSAIATRGRPSCSAATTGRRNRRRDRRCPRLPPWTEIEQLAFEKEALGLYMSGHPLERFADGAEGVRRAARRRADAARSPTSGSAASSAGLRPLKTKKGDRMASSCSTTSPAASRSWSSRKPSASTAISSPATRCCSCAASSRTTTRPRGIVATELQPISLLKERTTREVVIHLHGAVAATRSRRSRSCSRATAATAASRSSST